ncbi:MAG: hypothetical protein IKH73_02210 [Erysipelotrichaceae bacterium]|nr:hypothetical protein [Erysipelotrichaceae bacterium]
MDDKEKELHEIVERSRKALGNAMDNLERMHSALSDGEICDGEEIHKLFDRLNYNSMLWRDTLETFEDFIMKLEYLSMPLIPPHM